MKTLFFVLLIVQAALEAVMAVSFSRLKNTWLVKKCVAPFVGFVLLLAACVVWRFAVPYSVLVLSLATIFLHTFVGFYLDYYEKSQTFDRFLHAFGTFSSALLLFHLLKNLVVFSGSDVFVAVLVLLLGLSSGTVFELFEFVSDKISKTHNQKGLQDTNFDQLFNLIGALLASLLVFKII